MNVHVLLFRFWMRFWNDHEFFWGPTKIRQCNCRVPYVYELRFVLPWLKEGMSEFKRWGFSLVWGSFDVSIIGPSGSLQNKKPNARWLLAFGCVEAVMLVPPALVILLPHVVFHDLFAACLLTCLLACYVKCNIVILHVVAFQT